MVKQKQNCRATIGGEGEKKKKISKTITECLGGKKNAYDTALVQKHPRDPLARRKKKKVCAGDWGPEAAAQIQEKGSL